MDLSPLGLKPRHIADLQRMNDIAEAIFRFMQAGKQPPLEWVKEYKELFDRYAPYTE